MRITITRLSFIFFLTSGWTAFALAAPAGMEADAVTIQRAGIVYSTRAGDTLSSIASRFTPKRENWIVLGKLNHIGRDTAIPIGTRITIPADLLQDQPAEAKIIALSGTIGASSPDGQPVALKLGAQITEGMQIHTGANSFLTLLLPDQSRISLPSNSHIRIARLRTTLYTNSPRTEILLLNGKVESHVTPLEQNKGRFEVRTPAAVAGVRGTNFRVALGKQGTATEVLSGKVEVSPAQRQTKLMLSAGQGNITTSRAPGEPVALLPAPRLATTALRLNQDTTHFAVTPVTDARGYHLQIAADKDAQTILLEGYSSSTQLTLTGLSSGNYFARISAIDQHGLEGLAHIQAVSLMPALAASAHASMARAPHISSNESRQLVVQWQGLPGQQYHVQVARDPAFSWLLYSKKTATNTAHFARPAFGTYYARFQAVEADGSITPYSPTQAFVVTDQWIIHDGNPRNAHAVHTLPDSGIPH